MKKNYLYGALFLASLGLASCSQDDVINEEVTKPNENVQIEEGFKTLADFSFETQLGNAGNATASRTPGDIDDRYNPIGKYFLDYVYMLALDVKEQPISKESEVLFDVEGSKRQQHNLGSIYTLKYKLHVSEEDQAKSVELGTSYPGTVELQHGNSAPMTYKLSVFDAKKLKKATAKTKIPLNDFAFGLWPEGTILRGTSLRYTSYDPYLVGESTQRAETLTGRYISLPPLTDYTGVEDNILRAGLESLPDYPLVGEIKDAYFSGSEFLIAADEVGIYLLQVVPAEGENGGYFKVRKYEELPNGTARPDNLALNRLTTMINASFMLIDEKQPQRNPYFNAKSEEKTIANFERNYGVNLKGMECPYATIDGVNTKFFINEYQSKDLSTDLGRLALWAKGHEVEGVNGTTYNKQAKPSMKIKYNNGATDNQVSREGYGILGHSYSVAFVGDQPDNKGQNVNFWVVVDGAKVRISVPLGEGLSLNRNYSHNIVCYVPAAEFAQAVKDSKEGLLAKSRANGDEYVVLNLSSDCVVVE